MTIPVSEYDVALSFAGEDRSYVEQVAGHLKHMGIRVFYDGYEKIDMWGKDLYVHLSDVYQNKATYTIVFISRHYACKLWTKHELRSAQARAFRDNNEYVLPARFDDTEIPGVLDTIGYLDLRQLSPLELAEAVCEKLVRLGGRASSEPAEAIPAIPSGDYRVIRVAAGSEVPHELIVVTVNDNAMTVVGPEWEGRGFLRSDKYIGRFKYHRGDAPTDCGSHELIWNGLEFRGRVQFDEPSWWSSDLVWRPLGSMPCENDYEE